MWGSIISAGAQLAGSLLDRDSAQDANSSSMEIARAQMAAQKEFAQHGIRWRVDDAKAAGIHPLFAMGASLPTYSPVSAAFQSDSIGHGLAGAGQDIGRAIDATRTAEERVGSRLQALTIERGELENDLLRAQISKLNAPGTPPPLPTAGPHLTSDETWPAEGLRVIKDKPLERTFSHPSIPHQEPGALPDVGFVRTPTGLAPVPSKDAKERIEDQTIPEIMWGLRNHVLPSIGYGSPPPRDALPAGAIKWEWHIGTQEWRPVYLKKGTKLYRQPAE